MSMKYKYSVYADKGEGASVNRQNFFANGQYMNFKEMNAGASYATVNPGSRQIFALMENESGEGKASNLVALFLNRLRKKKNKLRASQTSEYLKNTTLNMDRGIRENLSGLDTTTLSMLYINHDNVHTACVGTDYVYKYYKKENRLEKLENALSLDARLGRNLEMYGQPVPFVTSMGRAVPGKNYLLLSKSLGQALTPEEIAGVLHNESGNVAAKLAEKAREKGANQNLSAIYVQPKKRWIWWILFALIVLVACFFTFRSCVGCDTPDGENDGGQIVPTIQQDGQEGEKGDTPVIANPLNDVKAEIDRIAAGVTGTQSRVTYYIKNLATGEEISKNAEEKMYSASVIKLYIMAETYRQIDDGILKMDDRTKTNLRLMITESSNDSANWLTEQVGGGDLKKGTVAVTENAKDLGCTATAHNNDLQATRTTPIPKENWNVTSAKDSALILEKIYKGDLVSKAYSAEMLLLLQGQQRVNKLPKYLPQEAKDKMANKTGETSTIENDVGIVFTDKGDYIICVMICDFTNSPGEVQDIIARISEAVYNHVTKEEAPLKGVNE